MLILCFFLGVWIVWLPSCILILRFFGFWLCANGFIGVWSPFLKIMSFLRLCFSENHVDFINFFFVFGCLIALMHISSSVGDGLYSDYVLLVLLEFWICLFWSWVCWIIVWWHWCGGIFLVHSDYGWLQKGTSDLNFQSCDLFDHYEKKSL